MVAFADGTNQADFLMDSEVSSPKRRKISDTTGSVQSENTCDDSPSDIEGRANGHTESDDSQNSITGHVEQSNTTNCSTSQAAGNNEDFKESVLRDCVSAREKIYRNWKNLKEAFSHITPRKLLNILSEHKLVSVEHIPDVKKMSKSLALDCILMACTRQVFDQDSFEKFKQVTAEINSKKILVWETQVENPVQPADYNIKDENKTKLKQILKMEHIIIIKDGFLQQLIFTLNDQEQVVHELVKNGKSEHFFKKIFEEDTKSKGSVSCLVNCLCELQESYRPIKLFLEDLKKSHKQNETTKDAKVIECNKKESKIHELSHGLVERFKIKMKIDHNCDEKQVNNALEQGVHNTALEIQKTYGSYVEKTEPGCLEIYLSSIHGDIKNDLTSSLVNGAYLNLLKKIINVEEMKKLLGPGKYKLTTRIVTLQGTSQSNLNEDVQVVKHLISANRSFLIDEIDAEYLMGVFDLKGIQLPGIRELKDGDCTEQAEHFLKAIETNGLEEILLEVLKKEGMTYIYDRLQTFINVYAYKDISSLRKQFKKQFLTLVTAVDLDDVRPIFVDRNIFTTQLFETLEKFFKDKREEGMAQFLVEILKSGPLAMLTFVDSLYVCHMSELANSLLEPTENIEGKYQEIEIVQNLSDQHTEEEECLFEGIFELIVRETDTAENSRIVTPTVGLSLTTTLSGENYKLETVPQNEDNGMKLSSTSNKIGELEQSNEKMKNPVVQHKPYKLGQSIFHLHHQFDLTSVINDKWINVTGGVMMDDGRLVLCLIYMEILICNTDGSKTDNIQLMCQPKSITAINSFTVAVMSVDSDYIEMYDINNKNKINSIQLHKGWDRGITSINNNLVVHSYGELYIMDHQTGEIVQTMSVVQEYNSDSHIPCVHATGDRIFYNDGHTKKLYCYSCTDKKESTTTLPSIPEKITSLQDGSLYVVCKDVPVQHVSSDGKHYNRVATNELKSVKDYNVFSYNQKQRKLVTCTSDGTVQVFNDK